MTARVMQARFSSSCGACGASIRKGGDIRYVRGLPANHEGCGDPAGEPRSSGGYSRYVSAGRGSYVRCTHEDYPCCGCGS